MKKFSELATPMITAAQAADAADATAKANAAQAAAAVDATAKDTAMAATMTTALAGKAPVVHTHTIGEVTGLTAALATATGKRRETYSGTTAANGQFSTTFGTAFSVAPNIQANLINALDNQNIRITSITTTGFTVLARTRTDALGLLPSWANASGLGVDVIITEK